MWIRRPSEIAVIAALLTGAAGARAAPPTWAVEPTLDPYASYREPFKLGLERYRAGAIAEAVGHWEPIYRELGEEKGYRLAYDLGVAYQELGDATRAAERLESFLTEAEARSRRGEATEPLVAKEEVDARARVARLIATKGRIRIAPRTPPRTAQVDANEPRVAGFVAWVTPGEHRVTFGVGTPDAETRIVHVLATEVVDVAPSPLPSPPPGAPALVRASSSQVLLKRETHHPFAWPLLALSGGIGLFGTIAAIPLYDEVSALYGRLSAQSTIAPGDREKYSQMRTLAYSVTGGAIGFGALTAGLAAWYFLGSTEREVMVTPALAPENGGASLGVTGRF